MLRQLSETDTQTDTQTETVNLRLADAPDHLRTTRASTVRVGRLAGWRAGMRSPAKRMDIYQKRALTTRDRGPTFLPFDLSTFFPEKPSGGQQRTPTPRFYKGKLIAGIPSPLSAFLRSLVLFLPPSPPPPSLSLLSFRSVTLSQTRSQVTRWHTQTCGRSSRANSSTWPFRSSRSSPSSSKGSTKVSKLHRRVSRKNVIGVVY